jgi:uncharacterized MAPEG superfamily protein
MFDWLAVGSTPIFAISCAILSLEMGALVFITPLLRARRNVWLNEEDAKRFSGIVGDVEHRDVARIVRVHRNQLENFTPFFALGVLWIAGARSAGLGAMLFITFVLARTAHLAFYLARMGRLRTASHTVGFLVLLVLAGGVAWRAIQTR